MVKSSLLLVCLLVFSLGIGAFSGILYKGFRSTSIDFGAGSIFGSVGVSDPKPQQRKSKDVSSCPNQGSSSVAFTSASVLGCCYTLHSQPAASVAVCAYAWEKTKEKDKINQPIPPSLWTEMLRRPRLLPKGFCQFCKGLCCRWERGSRRQQGSTKPGPTLQYRPC